MRLILIMRQTGMKNNTDNTKYAWQRMLSGRRLDLLNPSPLDVEIGDIAHGLARVARWNGQTSGYYPFSVAQHSLLVEEILCLLYEDAPRTWKLAALLHDSPEYVIGDLISPFKTAIGEDYKIMEKKLLEVIHTSFGIFTTTPAPVTKIIKQADRLAAYFEAVAVAGFSVEEAEKYFGGSSPIEKDYVLKYTNMQPFSTMEAERRFLDRFYELSSQNIHNIAS
jgi:5'-deoxynucleotidase YfbR-like HD superfamily hydrolase